MQASCAVFTETLLHASLPASRPHKLACTPAALLRLRGWCKGETECSQAWSMSANGGRKEKEKVGGAERKEGGKQQALSDVLRHDWKAAALLNACYPFLIAHGSTRCCR